MTKHKAVALGGLMGVALVLASLSSAVADQRFHGGYARGGYGGYGHGSHGGHHGYGYGVWPVFGLAAAVVGTAAEIVTAPLAILAAATNVPYYGPAPGYAAPPVAYYSDAPPAPGYYGPPPRAYYPAAPAYYGPPARAYYRSPAPAYYGTRQAYYAPRRVQYGAPPHYRGHPAPPPGYSYGR